ncbi:hypothetical protein ACC771_25815, partial [Rhizobium ruizarguesonis]
WRGALLRGKPRRRLPAIALSSVMVLLIGLGFHDGPGGWRADWIGGALYCAASLVVVFLLLPSAPAQSAQAGKEPALV